MVPQPANAARLAATLHMAAMDLCDVATKQDQRGRQSSAGVCADLIKTLAPADYVPFTNVQ